MQAAIGYLRVGTRDAGDMRGLLASLVTGADRHSVARQIHSAGEAYRGVVAIRCEADNDRLQWITVQRYRLTRLEIMASSGKHCLVDLVSPSEWNSPCDHPQREHDIVI